MSFIIFSRANCGQCAKMKAKLKIAGLYFRIIDLEKNPEQTEILKKQGFRSLPIFLLPEKAAYFGSVISALKALKPLREADLKECKSFSSPASDHFEARCNERRKDFLRSQIDAIEKFLLEAKNG